MTPSRRPSPFRIWPAAFCMAAGVVVIMPAAADAGVLSKASRIGPTGIGPIVFGMTPAQAAATRTRLVAMKPARGSTCFYLRTSTVSGVLLMVEHGTIRRAEVKTRGLRTTDGFQVGDARAKIEAFYGSRARAVPEKYDLSAQRITILPKGPADAKFRMAFIVRGGTVQAIIAGALPQVTYVEGCS